MSGRRDPDSSVGDALGVTVHADGVDVAVYSALAERVELCLFDDEGVEDRVELVGDEGFVWRGHVGGVAGGQRYGLRVHGPFDPSRGWWCDPAKLLLDPYARAIDGTLRRSDELSRYAMDSAACVPRSVVVDDDGFDWGDDQLPERDWDETVIYELHVRGATLLHPGVPPALRGTYLGVAHDAFVEHLVELGVTAVELLPVHEWLDEPFLVESGLNDYWGYNSIGFFAPTQRYRTALGDTDPTRQVAQFKAMVRALHLRGIEVLLDVVYNHTAEGGTDGETFCMKGLDAPAYYRIDDDGTFVDTTGCGTSLNAGHPAAVGLVLDSLRYWATSMHVDGFRFDLAPTLARIKGRFDPSAPILAGCRDDPVLARRKLICEPWDADGEDGDVLGSFEAPFREWNGEFRDGVRDFWRGTGSLSVLATRMAGSTDLFGPERGSTASVNFVTCHDGFTARDLVSYEHKHNEANGEQNRDGSDDNRSQNCGVEGESDDRAVVELRHALVRGLLTTLLMGRGVPMLLGGDELWRTQRGNNNAYCQDNDVSWLDWGHVDNQLVEFVARLVGLRQDHARLLCDDGVLPSWRLPSGATPTETEWHEARAISMRLADRYDPGADAGDVVCVLVNGSSDGVEFRVADEDVDRLCVELSSADPAAPPTRVPPDGTVLVAGRSVSVVGRSRGAFA